jgi:hypothetical protein
MSSEVIDIVDLYGDVTTIKADLKYKTVNVSSIYAINEYSPDKARELADVLYAKASAIDGKQSCGEQALELLGELVPQLEQVVKKINYVGTEGYATYSNEQKHELKPVIEFITRAKQLLDVR